MAYDRLGHLIPEIWAPQLLSRLNDALVFGSVVNRDYEGEIRSQGDVVKINEIGPVSVNTYSATSTSALTVQTLSDAQKLLKIDQAKYFSFWIDDLDRVQAKPDAMDEAMAEAAHAMANNVDEYIAALYTDAALVAGGSRSGSTITGQNITSTNVLKYLSIAQQKLDEKNVPQMGRWLVVPPWFHQKLWLAKVVHDTDNSTTLTNGGFIGRFAGFDIYMSNNVTNGTPAADDACVMFGYRGSISLAVQIVGNPEIVRPSFHFKDLVKGLMVYGAKVVRPSTLGVLYADYTAEAS